MALIKLESMSTRDLTEEAKLWGVDLKDAPNRTKLIKRIKDAREAKGSDIPIDREAVKNDMAANPKEDKPKPDGNKDSDEELNKRTVRSKQEATITRPTAGGADTIAQQVEDAMNQLPDRVKETNPNVFK